MITPRNLTEFLFFNFDDIECHGWQLQQDRRHTINFLIKTYFVFLLLLLFVFFCFCFFAFSEKLFAKNDSIEKEFLYFYESIKCLSISVFCHFMKVINKK